MRHRVAGRKLGRKTAHRMMMFRNMVTSLLDKEHIRTTLPKAKEVRPLAERMITLGKRETLHARRRALAFIKDPEVVKKLFDTLAPRFADRNGGYTRIIRLGFRDGDGAPMALLELLGSEFQAPKEEKKGKVSRRERKAKAKAAAEAAKEEAPKPKARAKKATKAKKEAKDEKTSKTKRKKKTEPEE